jgi:drug/metabolite transporter (DMT)-like permease
VNRIPPTALALATIVQWSFLAWLGASLSHIPSFFLTGFALSTSGLVGMVYIRQWRVPLRVFANGLYGLFGYHLLLFMAFRLAPTPAAVVEANLINYLWPLLTVVLTPVILSGYRLRRHHVVGAALGLTGAALIVTGGRFSLSWEGLPAYLAAGGAAIVWATYSLFTKRLPTFPTAAVGSFCLAAGVLSFVLHLAFEPAPGPLAAADVGLMLVVGAFPLGLAFFTWDAALKGGDPRVIGALAYLTPMASTLVLVVLGGLPLPPVAAVAMVLIVAGAVVGSLDFFRRRAAPQPPADPLPP